MSVRGQLIARESSTVLPGKPKDLDGTVSFRFKALRSSIAQKKQLTQHRIYQSI